MVRLNEISTERPRDKGEAKMNFFFKKITLPTVFEWFFRGTEGKCRSGDWGQTLLW